ncbi:acyl-CoA dehydrogenase [Govanella unica]|uniref:Acyl-CoA dehydrogenase n=1 Tax=Govanella unica TaxID=2975056 RepID=A0A9X3TWX3_9PROT|nr:acyl-CoA dehydrogenase [Govania unica]MDA5193505.1 acyl-CoA dehydrogenase [Govania unica]
MTAELINRQDLEFLLFDVLDAERLTARDRYSDFGRETISSILDTAEHVAREYFAPYNQKGDANEPSFDGARVKLIPEMQPAWDAIADAGFLAAHHDHEQGGMQMPEIVHKAAMSYFYAANIGFAAYPFLTIGAANLIESFGNADQKARFLLPMLDGRFSGTMALTEPGQGSALADIKTMAEPAADGSYRLKGQKMFISAGDHDLTQNIVHMVLAKIKGAPAGVKGISLFICPKFLVDDAGRPTTRNDVKLAGLLHKMGYRQTSSTVLSFGEEDACVGYLIGEPHRGLEYMFQMMNEARIGVALGAASLGYVGYRYSLNYARERPQGRSPANKDPNSPQIMIIGHADVRRMLLAQKTYAEGALALCLMACALVDDQNTADDLSAREHAGMLLDFLTPVVKTWSSEYGLKANELAIQVLGGSGYIREYPVEQYYRDNRLNPIHEGATGIHGLDLQGRKMTMKNMALFRTFVGELDCVIAEAAGLEVSGGFARNLQEARDRLEAVSLSLVAAMQQDAERGLANATVYLDFVGRIVAAWVWLRQAMAAERKLVAGGLSADETNFLRGKLQAARYMYDWELPQIVPQAKILTDVNRVCYDMEDGWF